jgi:hypothetical protein
MSYYTTAGMGDGTYPDIPEDTRPICQHCGKHFTPASGEEDEYCSVEHWHLNCLGIIKNEIESWLRWEYPIFKIMGLFDVCYGQYMTDSSVNRWKRAIVRRFEYDAAIIAQATEMENYHNGY